MGDHVASTEPSTPSHNVLRSSASKSRHRSASMTRSAPTSPSSSPVRQHGHATSTGPGGESTDPTNINSAENSSFVTPVKKLNLSELSQDQKPPLPPVSTLALPDSGSKKTPGSAVKRVMAHQKRRSSSITLGSPLPIPKHSAEVDYNMQHIIGEGITSKVYLGSHKRTGEPAAIKIINKSRIISNPDLVREVTILKRIRHPNIVCLKDVYITEEDLQIVMELCEGQELFEEIINRHSFTENDAKDVVRAVLTPIEYLHSLGIVHRDIKPENIMFVKEDNFKELKIVDFGFARFTTDQAGSRVGTLGYKAPEVFSGENVTSKADVWAVGVITYILLCGFPPFFSCEHYKNADMLANAPFWFFFNDETDDLLNEIRTGKVSFPPQFWQHISLEAKDFIMSLLQVDPETRLSAAQALKHPWLTTSTLPPVTPRREKRGADTVKVLSSLRRAEQRHRAVTISAARRSGKSDVERTQSEMRSMIDRHLTMKSQLISRKTREEVTKQLSQRGSMSNVLSGLPKEQVREYLLKRRNSLDSLLDEKHRIKLESAAKSESKVVRNTKHSSMKRPRARRKSILYK